MLGGVTAAQVYIVCGYTEPEKYQNGVTLFRQEQYWKSRKVELNRNTLANWIIRSSRWFKPVYELMREELLRHIEGS